MRAELQVEKSLRALRSLGTAATRYLLQKRPVPLSVTAAPTNRCPARCRYCAIPELGRSEEHSEAWWIETLDELRGLGMQRLGFTGGEPLLFEGIERIVARARELGVLVSLGTNGLLVPSRAATVSRLNYMVVSVDGPRELNDFQRFEGSYDAAMEAIRTARSLGVPVWVTSVVTRRTMQDLAALLAWAERHELRLNLQLPFHPESYCGLDNSALFPTMSEIEVFLRRVKPLSGPNGRILNSRAYWAHVERWVGIGQSIVEEAETGAGAGYARCLGGRLFFHIEPDGRVYPCAHQVGSFQAKKAHRSDTGLEIALEEAGRTSCATCLSAYAQEQSLLFGLQPRAVLSWAAAIMPVVLSKLGAAAETPSSPE